MSAFNKNQLPASVDTLEKLIVWAGTASYHLNKIVTATEGSGPAQKVAQFGIFNVESNNTSRIILRHSLELEDVLKVKLSQKLCESSNHNTYHCNINKSFRGFWKAFIILT